MIRIALCDDSLAFLDQTKSIIEHWEEKPANFDIQIFEDGDALLQSHINKPFDIIFLDVVMPLFNGIEVAKELREKDEIVKVVFLSSSTEFALESYQVKASNYLLKPINPDSLFSCLKELIDDMHNAIKCIAVKDTNTTYKIKLSNIEYVEAQGKLVNFCLVDGRKISAVASLYPFEDFLSINEGFFKCHRSYVVNMHHIDIFSSKEISMHSGDKIPISRSKHKEFEKAYFSVAFGKAGEPK